MFLEVLELKCTTKQIHNKRNLFINVTQKSNQREPRWSLLEWFTKALSICLNWDIEKLVLSTNMCRLPPFSAQW